MIIVLQFGAKSVAGNSEASGADKKSLRTQ